MPEANKHIVLGLEGVFMAFGTDSNFFVRNSDAYPSKSAIVGMICAAMGEFKPSETLLESLCGTMEVDGYTRSAMVVYNDMQNMGAGYDPKDTDRFMRNRCLLRTNTQKVKKNGEVTEKESLSSSKISHREYLTDIRYRVVLTLSEKVADRVISALKNPVHGPFLGRKCCAPTNKVFREVYPNKEDAMNEDLFGKEWKRFIIVRDGSEDDVNITEAEQYGQSTRVVSDVPVSFERLNRKYKSRMITYCIIET